MASLSLQTHRHRAGHLIVAKGTSKNTCGDQAVLYSDSPFTHITRDEGHRPANPRLTPLEVFEGESGGCFWEDRVVRIESHYCSRES
jgi:mannose-1-phosphate guanylyltransferase / mannose-6-phosphate isomerase